MLKPFRTVCGVKVFAERRRYSNQTYTWLYARFGDEFFSLGDPWPCVVPKLSDIEREVKRIIEERTSTPVAHCKPEVAAFIDPNGALQAAGLLRVDDEPFTLRNDPPRKTLKLENSDKTHQARLFSGMDCLPGQNELFNPE